jgi:predicted Zn-dependent protease
MVPHSLRSARTFALLAAGVLVAGCATNPVTGQRQLALISEAQEISMGQEAAVEVRDSIGLVDDAAMQSYVSRVGLELASGSERPKLPWAFAVVDDPTPNAFALPGGFIFVTRGLMTLLDSEAELASVLGHEIGHITARHSVSMISRQQLTQLGLGLGGALFPEIQPMSQALGAGMQLLFLERQADELGFRYARNTGYDVREMADVFAALGRASQLEGQSPLPNWLASHPAPADRIEAARQRVAAAGPQPGTPRQGRMEYLERIDGLIYGENPRNGFFRDRVFYHPDLRFQMTMPAGWQTGNFARAVVAADPAGTATISLTLAGDMTPAQATERFFAKTGVESAGSSRETFNGIPAVVSGFRATAEQGGTLQGYAAYLQHRGTTYQLLAYATSAAFSRQERAMTDTIRSFAPVTSGDVLNIQPQRIDIVRVPRQLTLAAFDKLQPSSIPLETLAVLNQLDGPSAPLTSGSLFKRVIGDRREPATPARR